MGAGSGTDSGRSVSGGSAKEMRWRRGAGLLGEVSASGQAIAKRARGVVVRLFGQHFVEHAQGALEVALRGVDFGERHGGDRWRASPVPFASAFAADDRGGVGQIQTGFDHARHEITCDTQEAARAFLRHEIRLGAAHDFVAHLDARHQLGALHAQHARFQDELLAAEPLEIVVTVNHGAGIIAVRRGAGSSSLGRPPLTPLPRRSASGGTQGYGRNFVIQAGGDVCGVAGRAGSSGLQRELERLRERQLQRRYDVRRGRGRNLEDRCCVCELERGHQRHDRQLPWGERRHQRVDDNRDIHLWRRQDLQQLIGRWWNRSLHDSKFVFDHERPDRDL